MSHFTVLVIGDNPEEQLEPYNENTNMPEYETDCHCIRDVHRADVRRRLKEEFGGTFDEVFRIPYNVDRAEGREVLPWGEYIKPYFDREKELMAEDHPMKDKPDPSCGFYTGPRQDWWDKDAKEGDRYQDESGCGGTGRVMSTYNPESKWDWYQIGGRWLGYFKVRPDAKKHPDRWSLGQASWGNKTPKFDADIVLAGDVDWEGMVEEDRDTAERDWEKAQGEDPKDGYWHYNIHEDETREEYIKRQSTPATFAVVKDGEWYQRGKMGWWACVSNEMEVNDWMAKFWELVHDLPPDTTLTLFDCHI